MPQVQDNEPACQIFSIFVKHHPTNLEPPLRLDKTMTLHHSLGVLVVELTNGNLQRNTSKTQLLTISISNIFYILMFVIVFLAVVWATKNTNMLSVPYYILTSPPVSSTTLRTKPDHVHNGCLQTFLCYKCVSRVMVNVDSIFSPQTFSWNGSYEMSMCISTAQRA